MRSSVQVAVLGPDDVFGLCEMVGFYDASRWAVAQTKCEVFVVSIAVARELSCKNARTAELLTKKADQRRQWEDVCIATYAHEHVPISQTMMRYAGYELDPEASEAYFRDTHTATASPRARLTNSHAPLSRRRARSRSLSLSLDTHTTDAPPYYSRENGLCRSELRAALRGQRHEDQRASLESLVQQTEDLFETARTFAAAGGFFESEETFQQCLEVCKSTLKRSKRMVADGALVPKERAQTAVGLRQRVVACEEQLFEVARQRVLQAGQFERRLGATVSQDQLGRVRQLHAPGSDVLENVQESSSFQSNDSDSDSAKSRASSEGSFDAERAVSASRRSGTRFFFRLFQVTKFRWVCALSQVVRFGERHVSVCVMGFAAQAGRETTRRCSRAAGSNGLTREQLLLLASEAAAATAAGCEQRRKRRSLSSKAHVAGALGGIQRRSRSRQLVLHPLLRSKNNAASLDKTPSPDLAGRHLNEDGPATSECAGSRLERLRHSLDAALGMSDEPQNDPHDQEQERLEVAAPERRSRSACSLGDVRFQLSAGLERARPS